MRAYISRCKFFKETSIYNTIVLEAWFSVELSLNLEKEYLELKKLAKSTKTSHLQLYIIRW